MDGLLTQLDTRALIRVARESLRAHLRGAPAPTLEMLFGDAAAMPPGLAERRGVFVTLTNGERLRGCTGFIEGRGPLWEAVRDLAVSSASRDRRFVPIAPEEEPQIRIEISVLTPARPIDPSEVVIGRHGLIMRMRGRSGLLLPQVATEWGWDVEEFLARTCEKAGLARDAWKSEECRIFGFEAQVFHEEEVAVEGDVAEEPL